MKNNKRHPKKVTGNYYFATIICKGALQEVEYNVLCVVLQHTVQSFNQNSLEQNQLT